MFVKKYIVRGSDVIGNWIRAKLTKLSNKQTLSDGYYFFQF